VALRAPFAINCSLRPASRCGSFRLIYRVIQRLGPYAACIIRPRHEAAKLVQCVRGRVFDVALDLRSELPSFGLCVCTELSADGNRLFYIPNGCAHGFLTLEDNSDLVYYMADAFVAGAERGVRWDDPAFKIPWPSPPLLMSDRDASYPDYQHSRGRNP
jgi:dTDP-4-dehydrorhamnose 3,5-epimerase